MRNEGLSRRLFLTRSATGVGSAWLVANLPEILAAHQYARRASRSRPALKFQFFDPAQAADVEAMAAQIIPTDSTPGAREARVIYFIDRALITFDRDKQEQYTRGLRTLNSKVAEMFAPAGRFSALNRDQQLQVLEAIEKSEFFDLVRVHTITGFLANPEYGGNHQAAGWKLLAFEDRHAFEPPFGFYDRNYKDGE